MTRHWKLGPKLALLAAPFVLLALASIAAAMWLTWQIESGTAAYHEASGLRSQAYRLSLAAAADEPLAGPAAAFEASLALLRSGDAERPLALPADAAVRARLAEVERGWQRLRAQRAAMPAHWQREAAALTAQVDSLLAAIDTHLERWSAWLHMLQLAMVAMVVAAAAVLVYAVHALVLEPIATLKEAMRGVQHGDFAARVGSFDSDEFDALAAGFNGMADELHTMYRHLEARVAEKTAELEDKRERLEALYGVTALVATATQLDELAQGFARRISRVARADGVALRWSDEANQRYLMLAAEGLPQAIVNAEHCISSGDCHCGALQPPPGVRVIPIRNGTLQCAHAGFQTLVSVPIRVKQRVMGEVDLFFHAQVAIGDAERSLLEALTSHLAGAMENLRLNALEKEAAVSQERGFLARELHDSIAQSLAFLKIQVQLMHDALGSGDVERMRGVLGEIDVGVRESYGDVRELLLHFRTRTNAEDIEPALQTTLRKFEHQSGLPVELRMQGHGIPLAPDLQLQVLHIVQESLSNVRKHARASRVWLDVQQHPQWRFEVRDDGRGFALESAPNDETHVGLSIMAERAERIGAELDVLSTPGRGTSVVLILPTSARAVAPDEPVAARDAADATAAGLAPALH